jgi:hypothetical protein
MKMWKVLLILTVVLFAADMAFGQGCSQCKLLAEQGASDPALGMVDENSFGSNINYGILFLMTLPYIILFAFFHKRIFRLFRSLTNSKKST